MSYYCYWQACNWYNIKLRNQDKLYIWFKFILPKEKKEDDDEITVPITFKT